VRGRAYEHTLNSSMVPVGSPLLEISDIEFRFGGVVALHDVGFTVTQGHIHAVIGPNGAGKSSLLNCVSGLYHPQQGLGHPAHRRRAVTHELTSLPPHKIARLGVARSFQNIELFSTSQCWRTSCSGGIPT
jgi:branched-chain amino acid transport system ATP-binding protein